VANLRRDENLLLMTGSVSQTSLLISPVNIFKARDFSRKCIDHLLGCNKGVLGMGIKSSLRLDNTILITA
jgi:hypothetical protein